VCADAIARRRRDDLAAADAVLRGAGYCRYFVTFTLRHGRGDALDTLIGQLSASLRKWRQRRGVRRILDDAGFQGQARTVEVLHGANGWHPHAHALFVLERELTPDEVETLERQWVDVLRKAGGDGLEGVALDVQPVRSGGGDGDSISDYLCKTGTAAAISHEIAGTGKSASAGRSPAMLLRDSSHGDRDAGARFAEFVAAMKGKAQMYWSPGFRAASSLDPADDEDAASEAEASGDETDDDAEVLALPAGAIWVLNWQSVRSDFLDLVEVEGPDEALRWYWQIRADQIQRRPSVPPGRRSA